MKRWYRRIKNALAIVGFLSTLAIASGSFGYWWAHYGTMVKLENSESSVLCGSCRKAIK
jgi:hypothetical protein